MNLSKIELMNIILSLNFVNETNKHEYEDKELEEQIKKIHSDYSRYFEFDEQIYARKKEKELKESLIKKLIKEYKKLI